MARYQYEPFPYVTPPELAGDGATGAPVIIVGAGPIGLAAAIDLATHGVASIVVDDNNGSCGGRGGAVHCTKLGGAVLPYFIIFLAKCIDIDSIPLRSYVLPSLHKTGSSIITFTRMKLSTSE